MGRVKIYDIEVLSNCFMVRAKDPKTKEIKSFNVYHYQEEVIHNDFKALMEFVPNLILVGFNSLYYDDLIINALYQTYIKNPEALDTASKITNLAFNESNQIINHGSRGAYPWNKPFLSIDLMKLNYLEKSLKLTSTNLKYPSIQDFPIKIFEDDAQTIPRVINPFEFIILNEYLDHDIGMTEAVYNYSLEEILLRVDISKRYGIDVLSESRSGVANRFLEHIYSEISGVDKKVFKLWGTDRNVIKMKEVIFPSIRFINKENTNILNNLKDYQFNYARGETFDKYLLKMGDLDIIIGSGGIHSVDEAGYFEVDNKTKFMFELDIRSMYPATIINNKICPAHLSSEFLKKYELLRNERIIDKKEGRKTEAEAKKIILNAVYGKMLSKFHWIRDALAGYKITINGQLYILMLIERIQNAGVKIISANTDGFNVICSPEQYVIVQQIAKQWEKETGYDLEETRYIKYARLDVNNYLCVKPDGKIKRKGALHKELHKEELSKGFSFPIVKIAVEEYILNKTPIAKTIREHTDVLDFCTCQNAGSKYRAELHIVNDGKIEIKTFQKTSRFLVSYRGGYFYKVDKNNPKNRTSFLAKKRVVIFNDVNNPYPREYEINYKFYIDKAMDLVKQIFPNKQTSFI